MDKEDQRCGDKCETGHVCPSDELSQHQRSSQVAQVAVLDICIERGILYVPMLITEECSKRLFVPCLH